ncbi:conserved membrane protein of unknown function [Rhodovastum atsumiense]|uniref:Uncharacterized protein n=1 Tax=Rhodovastum atsumiense TaxID=504468 RepID=A0A5M6IXA5_9PROT|nr:hypothetical protein [Rhodovastum atsumiense]KAA5612891.1 hypothetical protein F1189_07575 [Rhodovastum atsumiense]CAH2601031.1 conserved membrane protein of unknown function [Rhodovastum atsumiense]
MRYWAGAILFAAGAWMIFSALRKRRAAIASWHAAVAAGVTPKMSSLAGFALAMRPIIQIVLVLAALEVTASYMAVDGGRHFSFFDLGGFLFMLLGYGVWFSINTRYRIIPLPR